MLKRAFYPKARLCT